MAAAPKMIPLDPPRPLRADEKALLDFLVAATSHPELRAQARGAKVISLCNCGCPSLGLEPAEGSPRASIGEEDSDVGIAGALRIAAEGKNREGRSVEVILHVQQAQIVELEIWAGLSGGEVETDLPDVSTLTLQH